MNDRARIGLLVVIALLFLGGVLGALTVDEDDGGSAVGTTSTSSTSSTALDSTTSSSSPATSTNTSSTEPTVAPAQTTPTTEASPSSTTSTTMGGSGLNAAGTGQVASGNAPIPETGGPEWLFGAGMAALLLAGAFRRAARASS